MKTLRNLIAVTLLGIAPFAAAQINIPDLRAPGMSMESAVRLVTTSDVMLDRSIRSWLRKHYPDWDAQPHEIREVGSDRYAIVYLTSANNPPRRVYFRLYRSQADEGADF